MTRSSSCTTNAPITTLVGQLRDGSLRMLATSSEARVTAFPDVPTLAESGAKDFDSGAWYGFVVPKGTPTPIVERLRKATIEGINTDLVRARFANEGAAPIGSTPEEFRKMMEEESKRWAEVVKAANITLN